MPKPGLLEDLEEIGERAYLLDCEGFDGEEAQNDENGEGVEVIRQEAGYSVSFCLKTCRGSQGKYVALMPPTKV